VSKEKAAFYNIDLICEIKNETEMSAYRNDLEQWRQEQNRQFEEFIIDERELESRLVIIIRFLNFFKFYKQKIYCYIIIEIRE
jgi:hypothetical protein